MEYIKEITVDFAGEMFFGYTTATQGDTNSRVVKVTILNNAQPYIAPAGAKAIIRCKKPDGTSVFNDATINEDGTITAEITEQMLAAVGNCKCEISLYGADESSLTTVPFIVKVTPAAVSPTITSADEYTALTSALARVDDVSEVANTALTAATEALNNLDAIEADIDSHTAAAEAATEKANEAAKAAEAFAFSELPLATGVTGADMLPIVQTENGEAVTRRITREMLAPPWSKRVLYKFADLDKTLYNVGIYSTLDPFKSSLQIQSGSKISLVFRIIAVTDVISSAHTLIPIIRPAQNVVIRTYPDYPDDHGIEMDDKQAITNFRYDFNAEGQDASFTAEDMQQLFFELGATDANFSMGRDASFGNSVHIQYDLSAEFEDYNTAAGAKAALEEEFMPMMTGISFCIEEVADEKQGVIVYE